MDQDNHLGDDILRGADKVSEFMFGDSDPRHRRKIYHLVETERLPIFRLGKTLCARKTTLREWIAEQERLAISGLSSREAV